MDDEFETTPRARKRKNNKTAVRHGLLLETALGVLAVLCFLATAVIVLSVLNKAGNGGYTIMKTLSGALGLFAYLVPIATAYTAYYLWRARTPPLSLRVIVGALVFLLSVSTLLGLLPSSNTGQTYGGQIGEGMANYITEAFSMSVTAVSAFLLAIVGLIITNDRKPSLEVLATHASNLGSLVKFRKKNEATFVDEEDIDNEDEEEFFEDSEEPERILKVGKKVSARSEIVDAFDEEDDEVEDAPPTKRKKASEAERVKLTPTFTPPPLDLLNPDQGKSGAGDSRSKMQTIQKTLESFKIRVEMGEVTVGPTVTQFTLKPAQGINVQKITQLHDNLAMDLGAEFIRIEAPIPGKTLVGIEIPNEHKALLGLRSMLEHRDFALGGPLTLAIGKSIVGKPIFGDLEKMPHLLVAGATRTGKSVTLQNLLVSLLYKNSPYDLKLIILDPKRVEFSSYTNLPHLYTPIIKEPKGAIKALNWAIQEMERRYEILAEHHQVNLGDYNKKILMPAIEKARKKNRDGDEIAGLPPKMPYVVIVFDEYNDFMLSYPKEITPLITSLTQKGRAAGIHLILATQRPDVKVITGTIKANIPARIALKTTSGTDSRTILDTGGAEDLLGNGDMLYMASDNPRLVRIQAPFISPEEVREVVEYIKGEHIDYIPDHIDIAKVRAAPVSGMSGYEASVSGEPDDEDYLSAKDFVIETRKASTSQLQTSFSWGYNRAARVMNQLTENGVISDKPANGSRYREVLAMPLGTTESDAGSQADELFTEN